MFSTVWGLSRISGIHKFSRVSRTWTLLKDHFSTWEALNVHLANDFGGLELEWMFVGRPYSDAYLFRGCQPCPALYLRRRALSSWCPLSSRLLPLLQPTPSIPPLAEDTRVVLGVLSGMARIRLLLDLNGPLEADQNGPKWTILGQNGSEWTSLVHFGLANAKIRFGIGSF